MIDKSNIPVYNLVADYKANVLFIWYKNTYDFNQIYKHKYLDSI